jgi:pyrroline-5-carboxylate reductase
MTAFKSLYDICETWLAYPLCLIVALAAGLALALVYRYVKKGYAYVRFMPLAIVIIPVAMAALVGFAQCPQ